MIILGEGEEGRIIKGHLKIKHKEVVYSLAGYIGIAVKYSSRKECKGKITAEADEVVFQALQAYSRENTKAHNHGGNDENERML